MNDTVRVVTRVSFDDCVRHVSGILDGFCLDIWRKAARDLNLTYKIEEVQLQDFKDLFKEVNANRADVILHGVSHSVANSFNLHG